MLRTDKQSIRSATMACWWPNPVYHPDRAIDWRGIEGELRSAASAAITCRDDYAEATELTRLANLAAQAWIKLSQPKPATATRLALSRLAPKGEV